MCDANVCVFVGRLAAKPTFIPGATPEQGHVEFTLMINRVVSRKGGPSADPVPCSLWGPEALRFLNSGVDTGSEVRVVCEYRCEQSVNGNQVVRRMEFRVQEFQVGRKSRKNMAQPEPQTAATRALDQLTKEFNFGGV